MPAKTKKKGNNEGSIYRTKANHLFEQANIKSNHS